MRTTMGQMARRTGLAATGEQMRQAYGDGRDLEVHLGAVEDVDLELSFTNV